MCFSVPISASPLSRSVSWATYLTLLLFRISKTEVLFFTEFAWKVIKELSVEILYKGKELSHGVSLDKNEVGNTEYTSVTRDIRI